MKARVHAVFYGAALPPQEDVIVGYNYAGSTTYDLETGEVVAVMPGASRMVSAPDGDRVLSTYNGVHVHDPRTGERTVELELDDQYHRHIAWSADGARVIATHYDTGTLRVWDASTGALIASHEAATPSNALERLPDGRYGLIRAGSSDIERLGPDGQRVDRVAVDAEEAWHLRAARDAPRAALIADHELLVLDLDSGEVIARFEGHRYARGLAIDAAGERVAAMTFGGVVLLDVESAAVVGRQPDISVGSFRRPVFRADGRVVVADGDWLCSLDVESGLWTPRRPPPSKSKAEVDREHVERTLAGLGGARGYRDERLRPEGVDRGRLRVRFVDDGADVTVDLDTAGALRVLVTEPGLVEPDWTEPGALVRLARWIWLRLVRRDERLLEDHRWATALADDAELDRAPGALQLRLSTDPRVEPDRVREWVDATVERWRDTAHRPADPTA